MNKITQRKMIETKKQSIPSFHISKPSQPMTEGGTEDRSPFVNWSTWL